MDQVIPEFNQNNGEDAMDDQLNLDNENWAKRSLNIQYKIQLKI